MAFIALSAPALAEISQKTPWKGIALEGVGIYSAMVSEENGKASLTVTCTRGSNRCAWAIVDKDLSCDDGARVDASIKVGEDITLAPLNCTLRKGYRGEPTYVWAVPDESMDAISTAAVNLQHAEMMVATGDDNLMRFSLFMANPTLSDMILAFLRDEKRQKHPDETGWMPLSNATPG